jgi:Domain of unknown function (DUF2017)
MSPKFTRRRGEAGVELEMSLEEHDLLASLPDQLRDLYESTSDTDPVRNRLFPRAYLDPTAEEAEQEWRDLVHPELLRGRLAALEQLRSSLDTAKRGRGGVVAVLSDDEVGAWLSVLNDARLALGTRLEITEDLDYDDIDPDDPRAPGFAAYGYLTYLQGQLIELLLEGMPE